MKMALNEYETLVFDCDGVVLNSNHVKTNAFYKTALHYGKDAAEIFVKYHTENGGISRYKKFEYFLEAIVPDVEGPNFDELVSLYAKEVVSGLLSCETSPGLKTLREQTPNSSWFIVSGGDQEELRFVFEQRGITSLFDGGIFGSPSSKKEILNREIEFQNIRSPAVFLGDSKYDYESAMSSALDFIFISGWTDMSDWSKWIKEHNINAFHSLESLL